LFFDCLQNLLPEYEDAASWFPSIIEHALIVLSSFSCFSSSSPFSFSFFSLFFSLFRVTLTVSIWSHFQLSHQGTSGWIFTSGYFQ
jgi:hypothetical protein